MEITTTTPEALRAILRAELQSCFAEATPPPTEYLTVAEAAEYVKMTSGGLRKWVNAGHLPAYTFGKVTRVKRADLDALLAGQTVGR